MNAKTSGGTGDERVLPDEKMTRGCVALDVASVWRKFWEASDPEAICRTDNRFVTLMVIMDRLAASHGSWRPL